MKSLLELITYHQSIPYLVEASLILCILYLPFEAIFKYERTFVLNRIYLLIIMAITIILPFYKINIIPAIIENKGQNTIISMPLESPSSVSEITTINIMTFYYIGVIILIIITLYQFLQIYLLIRKSPRIKDKDEILIINRLYPVSSFFKYIIIPNKDVDPLLLSHEKIHAKQYHSIDKIIFELFKIAFWFHPLTYMIGKSISVNHEYICDNQMAKKYTKKRYAQLILTHAEDLNKNQIFNYFNSFIKKRIAMMTNQKNQKNQKNTTVSITMFLTFTSIFTLFGIDEYHVIKPTRSNNQVLIDSISPNAEVDTIITLDPNTFKEKIEYVKRPKVTTSTINLSDTIMLEEVRDNKICKVQKIVTNTFPKDYFENNINVKVALVDTIITLDPQTYAEKVTIVSSSISKVYKELIDAELKKKNPDFDMIQHWKTLGQK